MYVGSTISIQTSSIVFGGTTIHNDLSGRAAADAHPISAITGLNVTLSAIPTDIAVAISAHDTNTAAHSNIAGAVQAIRNLIPVQATPTNQLADKAFVNSSVSNMAAHFLTSNAAGAPFPTRTALLSASAFYWQGAAFVPTPNDYCVVSEDEGAPTAYIGQQSRFVYDGAAWVYAYSYNKTFTAAESAALASGITDTLVQKLVGLPGTEYVLLPDYTSGIEIASQSMNPTFFLSTIPRGNVVTYGTPLTITEDGFISVEDSFYTPTSTTAVEFSVEVNGEVVFVGIAPKTVANSTTYFFTVFTGLLPVKKNAVIKLGYSCSDAITRGSVNYRTRVNFFSIASTEPKIPIFNDKGAVLTMANLPATADDFDTYRVTDQTQDYYARTVSGTLEWLPVARQITSNPIDTYVMPDYQNVIGLYAPNTFFPSGTLVLNVNKSGTAYIAPGDGYIDISSVISFSAADAIKLLRHWVTINGMMVSYQTDKIGRYGSGGVTPVLDTNFPLLPVRKGDSILLWTSASGSTAGNLTLTVGGASGLRFFPNREVGTRPQVEFNVQPDYANQVTMAVSRDPFFPQGPFVTNVELKGAPVIVPNDGFIQVFDNWGVSAGSGYNQHWLYINGIDCDFGLNVVPSIQTPASYVYKSGFFPVKRGDEIVFSMSFAGNSTITRNPARPYLKFYPALPVNYVRNSGTPIPDSATRSVLAAEVNGHAFFPLKADGTFGAPYTMTEGGFVFLDVGAMFPTTTTNISNHMTLYINGYLYSEVVFIENGSDGGSTTQRQMWASLYAVPVAAGDKLELKISCGYDNSYVMQYAAHGSELNWMRARIA